ncbi:uncharacterized protein LOC121421762 [Lytechinus variegatus]|uniref:uncharacterized protein LOC121421762 n=1 Tax=Lytechinus variegatus TaxID=7654 RepID=UPI001BB118D6|nr:uncharacterized protein LOC121421762 [Lytechinus variegatus]
MRRMISDFDFISIWPQRRECSVLVTQKSTQVLKMVQLLSRFSLLIIVLFGFSRQMYPATAGVIPLGENGTSLECGKGFYRKITYLASGRESHECMPCSNCPCGVRTMRECNSTMDTVCAQQCEDPSAVINRTLWACVSLLGEVEKCSHSKQSVNQSNDYPTTMTVSTFTLENVTARSKGNISPIRAFGISSGVVTFIALGSAAIILIARRRGYLNASPNKLCCTRTSPPQPSTINQRKVYKYTLTPPALVPNGCGNFMDRSSTVWTPTDNILIPLWDSFMADEELMKPLDLPLAEDINVNTDGEDPYWLVMRGWFTPQGGVLRCNESDVFLEIPPGAIPQDIKRQEIVAKVALVTSRFDFKLKKDEVSLSPVVELLSPGLASFESRVVIHIPHRARMDPDWNFKVHYTRSHGKTEEPWKTIDEGVENRRSFSLKPFHSDVTFRTNETHFVIETTHFSKYACSGCGKKRHLNLEALVSAKYLNLPNRQQVDLNCYIADTIKDYWHRVNENEGQRPRSERHPIHLKSKEPLVVSLLTESESERGGGEWVPWTLGGHRPTTVAIPMRNIVRCCSDAVPYFVTFSLRPKTSNSPSMTSHLFESAVSYKQKETGLDLPITIAFDLRGHACNTHSSVSSTPGIISPTLVRKVAVQIPLNKWKDLCRRLLVGDNHIESLIEELQTKHNDVSEVKYQMLLTWRQMKGKDATCYKLSQSLRACGLVNIAENVDDGSLDVDMDSQSLSDV